jgi:type IV fimbrial biogenesis protein FimT
MSRVLNSFDSRRPRPHRGFTVLEAMIVMVVAGVVATLAAPAFSDFVIRQRIRNASFELMSDLVYARSEAVKRNVAVTISKTGTWSDGWTVAAGDTVLRQHPTLSANITIAMANPSVVFLLNGRASGSANFTIDDAAGRATIAAHCVSVDPSGRPQSTEGSCS